MLLQSDENVNFDDIQIFGDQLIQPPNPNKVAVSTEMFNYTMDGN